MLHYFFVEGQVISFHDDSLKINRIYIDANTSPKQLDLILGSKHITVKSKSDFQINTHTGQKIKQVTYYYPDRGIAFHTYKNDRSKFSLSAKLSSALDPDDEFDQKLKKPFTGYLFIAGNDLTKNRSIDDIKKMKNVNITFQEVTYGSTKEIRGGQILYQNDVIRVNVDRETKEISAIHIYHNFKH
ncbi:MAG TPA: hypothetical protein VFG10_09165 [Saprospiraceae bacterium]|nr:hypothetical protein [Saprospiraceae bacterium]